MSTHTIGLDIGGTKVAAGVVDENGNILDRNRRDITQSLTNAQLVEDAIVDTITELLSRHPDACAVGVGAAGFVDKDQTSVLFAPHVPWRKEPLRAAIGRRVSLPVTITNDANAAVWAEYRFGAARGATHVVGVSVGTGIGGGIVLDGALMRGKFGIAGEFGHMTVVPNGAPCECGNQGCWEQYASGNALIRQARQLIASDTPDAALFLKACNNDVDKLTGTTVGDLAQAGEPAAVELVRETGRWLGVGLANLAAAFDPEVFVIGGGVADNGELLLDPARASFKEHLTGRGFRPYAEVRLASLRNDAGLVGAADLARQSLND